MVLFRFRDRWQGSLRRGLPSGPEIDSIAGQLEQRDRDLEAYLERGITEWATAMVTAGVPTLFDPGPLGSVKDFGLVNNTYLDCFGVGGAGYGTLTVTTPSRIALSWSATIQSVATGATFRTAAMLVGIEMDGANLFYSRALFSNFNAAGVWTPISRHFTQTLAPGPHTFKLYGSFSDTVPAAGTQPLLNDFFMTVLPLAPVTS